MSVLLISLWLAGAEPQGPFLTREVGNSAIQDVTNNPDRVSERDGARWSQWIFHQGGPNQCGTPAAHCVVDSLTVRNDSDRTLRCHGKIRYPQPNDHGIPDIERRLVILPGRVAGVVLGASPKEMKIAAFEADCTPEPPLPPLGNPPECRSKVIQAPDPNTFYPEASRTSLQEGPVIVEFTLSASPSSPTDIEVVQSSSYPDLDAAAIRMFGEVQMTTSCVGKRYRTMTSFKLR